MQEHEQKKVLPQWPALAVYHTIIWNQCETDIILSYFKILQQTRFTIPAKTCAIVKYPFDLDVWGAHGHKLERHRLYIVTLSETKNWGELPFDAKQVSAAALDGFLGPDVVFDAVSKCWTIPRLRDLV